MNELEGSYKKTAYDARLQFLEVLGGLMKSKAVSVADNDHYLQERLLRQMLYMMRTFIKQEQYNELIEKLDSARKTIRHSDSRFAPWVDNNLDFVDSKIYAYSAHVLMPVSSDDTSTELDEKALERFFSESDL